MCLECIQSVGNFETPGNLVVVWSEQTWKTDYDPQACPFGSTGLSPLVLSFMPAFMRTKEN